MPSGAFEKILEFGLVLVLIGLLVAMTLSRSSQVEEVGARYDESLLKTIEQTQKMAIWSDISQTATWDVYVYSKKGSNEIVNDYRGRWNDIWDFAASQLASTATNVDEVEDGIIKLLNGYIVFGYMEIEGYESKFVAGYRQNPGQEVDYVKELIEQIALASGVKDDIGITSDTDETNKEYQVKIGIKYDSKKIFAVTNSDDWTPFINFVGNYKKTGCYYVMAVGKDDNGNLKWITIAVAQLNKS